MTEKQPLTNNKDPLLRSIIFQEEEVQINLISELSPISSLVAWNMLVLATCSQGSTEEFTFLKSVIAQEDTTEKNLPLICLHDTTNGHLVLPKSAWLSEDFLPEEFLPNATNPYRLDESNISTLNFYLFCKKYPVITKNQRQYKLHECNLRTPSENEIRILVNLETALKQDFPIKLDREQTFRDLDLAAQIMGMDLNKHPHTQSLIETSTTIKKPTASLKDLTPIFSLETVQHAVHGTLRNLKTTGLLTPQ